MSVYICGDCGVKSQHIYTFILYELKFKLTFLIKKMNTQYIRLNINITRGHLNDHHNCPLEMDFYLYICKVMFAYIHKE